MHIISYIELVATKVRLSGSQVHSRDPWVVATSSSCFFGLKTGLRIFGIALSDVSLYDNNIAHPKPYSISKARSGSPQPPQPQCPTYAALSLQKLNLPVDRLSTGPRSQSQPPLRPSRLRRPRCHGPALLIRHTYIMKTCAGQARI